MVLYSTLTSSAYPYRPSLTSHHIAWRRTSEDSMIGKSVFSLKVAHISPMLVKSASGEGHPRSLSLNRLLSPADAASDAYSIPASDRADTAALTMLPPFSSSER